MKAKLVVFEHVENGVTLVLSGETEIEKSFIRALAIHGKMELNNGECQITCWKFLGDLEASQ